MHAVTRSGEPTPSWRSAMPCEIDSFERVGSMFPGSWSSLSGPKDRILTLNRSIEFGGTGIREAPMILAFGVVARNVAWTSSSMSLRRWRGHTRTRAGWSWVRRSMVRTVGFVHVHRPPASAIASAFDRRWRGSTSPRSVAAATLTVAAIPDDPLFRMVHRRRPPNRSRLRHGRGHADPGRRGIVDA